MFLKLNSAIQDLVEIISSSPVSHLNLFRSLAGPLHGPSPHPFLSLSIIELFPQTWIISFWVILSLDCFWDDVSVLFYFWLFPPDSSNQQSLVVISPDLVKSVLFASCKWKLGPSPPCWTWYKRFDKWSSCCFTITHAVLCCETAARLHRWTGRDVEIVEMRYSRRFWACLGVHPCGIFLRWLAGAALQQTYIAVGWLLVHCM